MKKLFVLLFMLLALGVGKSMAQCDGQVINNTMCSIDVLITYVDGGGVVQTTLITVAPFSMFDFSLLLNGLGCQGILLYTCNFTGSAATISVAPGDPPSATLAGCTPSAHLHAATPAAPYHLHVHP